MYKTIEEAREVLDQFKAERRPEALNPRIETRSNGEYRVVYDHWISRGKRASNKTHVLTRSLVAQLHVQISPELWAVLENFNTLTAEQASELRAAIEPQLPARWRFRQEWFEQGEKFACVYLVCRGKKTLVTSHCYEL